MTIESDDLAMLRETTSKALLALLWLHVPIAVVIGLSRGADWIMPAVLMIAMALAATMSWRASGNGLSTRLIFAVALMGGVSVFTYQLARISHRDKRIEAPNQRKFFCEKDFAMIQGAPRCRQSVAQNGLTLDRSDAAKLWVVLMGERSRRMPELCCWGRRIG